MTTGQPQPQPDNDKDVPTPRTSTPTPKRTQATRTPTTHERPATTILSDNGHHRTTATRHQHPRTATTTHVHTAAPATSGDERPPAPSMRPTSAHHHHDRQTGTSTPPPFTSAQNNEHAPLHHLHMATSAVYCPSPLLCPSPFLLLDPFLIPPPLPCPTLSLFLPPSFSSPLPSMYIVCSQMDFMSLFNTLQFKLCKCMSNCQIYEEF